MTTLKWGGLYESLLCTEENTDEVNKIATTLKELENTTYIRHVVDIFKKGKITRRDTDYLCSPLLDGIWQGLTGKSPREFSEFEYARKNVLLNPSRDALEFFLDRGADIAVWIDEAFIWACSQGCLEVAQALLEKGATRQCSTLKEASAGNHTAMVEFLLQLGPQQSEIENALKIACERGHLETVQVLFDRVPRHVAEDLTAWSDNLNIMKFRLEKGVNVHATNDSMVRGAASSGNLEAVQFLVEKGADIEAGGGWAISFASFNGHLEVVEFLLDCGAQPRNALCQASKRGHLAIVAMLFDRGVNVEEDNYLALCDACWLGDFAMVELLLNRGVNPRNNTALHYAENGAFEDIIALLRSAVENENRQA